MPDKIRDTFLKVPLISGSLATIVRFVYLWCRDNVKQDELQFQLGIRGTENVTSSWTGRTFTTGI